MFRARAHPRIFVLVGAAAVLALSGLGARGCGQVSGRTILAAVGERMELKFEDGRAARLAGLDVSATRASDALGRGWLGQPVEVAPLAPGPDRWGRWPVDVVNARGESASLELLDAGAARVRPEFETRGCEIERLDHESAARAAREGLWSEPGAILDAADLESLARNDGRFVIIEGAVRRVGAGRSRVYLDFGRRGGFTAVVARKWEPSFGRLGIQLGALAGRVVRVRGILDNRFGPRIEITDPLMIERVDGS